MNQSMMYEILKKYSKGSIVEDQDKQFIYKLTSLGLMRIGFTEQTENDIVETAMTTPNGINMYVREEIMKNPLKKFFYYLNNAAS